MDDDDDNESVISVSRTSENNAVGSKVANPKGTKESFIGQSSRRVRRRNRRYVHHILQNYCTTNDQI